MNDTNRYTVLLVENDIRSHSELQTYLEVLGCRVVELAAPDHIKELELDFIPDLILIDLAAEHALKMIHRLRKEKTLSHIPILASSSDGTMGIELYSKSEELGEQLIGYITRPISLEELGDQIKLLLSKIVVPRQNEPPANLNI